MKTKPEEKVEEVKPIVVEAFNAKTQQLEEAIVVVDLNNEFVFTFKDGSFFKLPATLSADEIKEHLEKHETSNVGQVSAEAVEKQRLENEAKLGSL